MSARVDADAGPSLPSGVVLPGSAQAPAAIAFDADDQFGGPALPGDHPAWLKDAVSVSQRARALVAKLKPVVLRVVNAWEHRVRTIVVAGRSVSVDPSGSYRVD
ncbi:MAG: hypothetical protein NVSMB19_05600 [Vulcanimicrobiaceae bacterium]